MTPPVLALTQKEAAKALRCSIPFFRLHILPELRVIRRGSRTLIPVKEIERWAEANAEPWA